MRHAAQLLAGVAARRVGTEPDGAPPAPAPMHSLRYRAGVTPSRCRIAWVKCCWLAKPQAAATSASGVWSRCSSAWDLLQPQCHHELVGRLAGACHVGLRKPVGRQAHHGRQIVDQDAFAKIGSHVGGQPFQQQRRQRVGGGSAVVRAVPCHLDEQQPAQAVRGLGGPVRANLDLGQQFVHHRPYARHVEVEERLVGQRHGVVAVAKFGQRLGVEIERQVAAGRLLVPARRGTRGGQGNMA